MEKFAFDLEALTSHPTRLRATAAAFALVIAGEQPSLTRVAEVAGTTRQNIHKSHPSVVTLVDRLRREWQPQPAGSVAELQKERDDARAEAAKERRMRKQVERERDKLMHHLELSDATVRALRQPAGTVTRLRAQ